MSADRQWSDPRRDGAHGGWTLKGRHVLAALVGFFGLMFAANIAFVYFAVSTFAGVSTTDAYRKGLGYNARLAAAESARRRGWTGEIRAPGGKIEIRIRKRDGTPVLGLIVHGRTGRPATDRFDRALAFREIGKGIYRADNAPLGAGAWIVTAQARRPSQDKRAADLLAKERLWIKR